MCGCVDVVCVCVYCVCVYLSVVTSLLWWEFYAEYETRQQLSETYSSVNDSAVSEVLSETVNQTSDVFNTTKLCRNNKTVGRTVSRSFDESRKFEIPLLFVSVDSESLFLTLSIVASLLTVRC